MKQGVMQEKVGSDGRRGGLEDACLATQKPSRLLCDSNGYQDKENCSEVNDKFFVKNEDEINGGVNKKLTILKVAQNSDCLIQNHLGVDLIKGNEDEYGSKFSKNKQWTNKVDGIAKKSKLSPENDEKELPQVQESNVRSFFTNLLKFSLKRLYATEDEETEESFEDGCTSLGLNEEIMGNLQTGESRRNKDGSKSPARKKGGFLSKKSPGKDAKGLSSTKNAVPAPPVQQKSTEEVGSRSNNESERVEEFLNKSTEEERKVVSPEGIVGAEDPTVTGPNGNTNSVELDSTQQTAANVISDAKYISTDSWRQVQNIEINKDLLSLNFTALSPQSRESSSESVFTDPLTPRGLAEIEIMKTEKVGESGSSTTSKTGSSITSQRQEAEMEDASSLDDVTLIDDQLTDTEADESLSAGPGKERSASLDVSTASTPCQRPSSFTLHKYKKVDLEPLTSITSSMISSSQDYLRRYSSVSEVVTENNVLRKVASLTLDKNTIEQKVHKPRFVPEKLDFQLYEKFEGQQLINWYISSFPEDHYLRTILAPQDLKILVAQFCTHMLAAGVLCQIPDKDAPIGSLFRPDLMYFWARSEAPAVTPVTPGRLSSGLWSSFSSTANVAASPQSRPGARYTEAELESPKEKENPMTASTGSVDKAIRKIETEEFQQVVIGLKREHKENITRLTRGQEVKLFKLRGEHAHILHEYEKKITELEETVHQLKQELEKQKTLADIQSLTHQTLLDFESPTKEKSIKQPFKNGSPTCSPNKISPERFNNLVKRNYQNGIAKKTSLNNTDNAKIISPSQSNGSYVQNEENVKSILSTGINGSDSFVSKDRIVQNDLIIIENDVNISSSKLNDKLYNEQNGNVIPATPKNLPSSDRIVQKEDQYKANASAAVSDSKSKPVPQSAANIPSPPSGPTVPINFAPPPPPMPPIVNVSLFLPPPPPPLPSGINPPEAPSAPGMGAPHLPPPLPEAKIPPPPPLPPCPSSNGAIPPPPPPPCSTSNSIIPPPPPPPLCPSSSGAIPPPPPPPSGSNSVIPPPPPTAGPPRPPPLGGLCPPPPPPPGGAPMPFPAPPVGGWNAQRAEVTGGVGLRLPELRKQPVNPAVPMKPLYWSRIIVPVATQPQELNSPGGTPNVPLWERLEEAKIEDYTEFNELFSRQIITRKPTKKKTQEPSKQQAAKILDSKRSQNVGILSSSLHVDFPEIEHAIYHFDTSVVNMEALQQIYEMRATEEELKQIREHVKSNPEIPLDKPEQFLLELAEIPSFADRIACFMFQSEHYDCINTIDSKLNNIKSTCEMLLNAESVKTVMAIILALGNYMNGGNLTRGQADGFGIEILPKLKDVKSKDSSVTLLHFIVRTYMKKLEDPLSPDLALPVPEPGDINRAAIVDFDEIKTDLVQLEKQLKVCQKKTEKVISASSEENLQPFKDKMEAFLFSAQKQILGEFENLEECKSKFRATMNFYQFKPKTEEEVKEFFTIWAPFSKDFKDIWKKEQQRLIKEKMQEFKKKHDVKKQEIKPVRAGGLKDKMKQRMSFGKR